jgi:2-polyprenyl-3-methyl-5-hydroxy-6-metoxy-1,4-benzoquinol methylase
MSLFKARNCPICGGRPAGPTFPYATQFNDAYFVYLICCKCKSVFVDPVPNEQTFEMMYAKSAYHDYFYDGDKGIDYSESVHLLRRHLAPSATVLDYGCGVGDFLKACRSQELVPVGVEFDGDAAVFAATNANCVVMTVEDFSKLNRTSSFDAIHLGDVLEHLPDPMGTLLRLLDYLKPGGILFLEGPLEVNPSPVLWASQAFGRVKRILKPSHIANDSPTHLFRTCANSQKAFFKRVDKGLSMRYWQVYETGWPYYRSGNLIKRSIALLAVLISGRNLAGVTFGNRFKAIMVKKY